MTPELPEEPRLAQALRVVCGRAAARPLRTLAGIALATALAVGARALLRPAYTATVTFRLREGKVLDQRLAPRPPSRIREYIFNGWV